jgi:taurine--2-oxoglutarate transaminase
VCTVAPQFANDASQHAVRMDTGRHKVLARYRSYHGGTDTAINLTGDPRRWPNDDGNSGVVHFFGPFLYRSPFQATTEAQECERALAHLDDVIRLEGPSTIAAIVLPPPGYLAGVRDLCDRYGIVFVADEVMAGVGRSGAWFAVEQSGVVQDLLTFAKGVNSGYVPLGGVAISPANAARIGDEVLGPGLESIARRHRRCPRVTPSRKTAERQHVSARFG